MRFNRILLINPPYEPIGVKESVSSVSITLSIAMLAGVAKAQSKDVYILDLNLSECWADKLDVVIKEYVPELVGITFTTPLVRVADEIASRIREVLGNKVLVIGGGPHATALPYKTLENTIFDAVAVGEAEVSFGQFLKYESFENIPGWVYKTNGNLISTGKTPLIGDLDDLPFAAVELFHRNRYTYPPESTRENPVCLLETSRGCYAHCSFCNKNIFGYKIRLKSSKRVVDEMEYILSCGYREIHLADDQFTADMNHAKNVCREIIRRRLEFPWVPRSGIRVDRVSSELLNLMYQAGCYHTPFGIESGNQEILDSTGKGITIEQIRNAISLAKEVGMETTGYFMIGLPGETHETVQQTIDFSFELELDHIKFGVTIPLPGTPLFNMYYQGGGLRTLDWEVYTYSTPPWEIYEHPTLDRIKLAQITINNQRLIDLANRSIHKENRMGSRDGKNY